MADCNWRKLEADGRVLAAGNRVPQITETQVYVLRVLERYESLVALDG